MMDVLYFLAKPTTSNDNITAISNNVESDFPFKVIGYIETGFANKRGVPRQPGILSESQGIVRLETGVLTNPHHALEGLEQFSHMWLV